VLSGDGAVFVGLAHSITVQAGDPEGFANIVAVLCSEYANFIVGQNLVDGGTSSGIF
jgi:NAD(P)-dependent dehydrogenase (short-subunit alcohol dehydrogenase family)